MTAGSNMIRLCEQSSMPIDCQFFFFSLPIASSDKGLVWLQENGLLMPEELSRQADQEGGVTYSVHSCGLDHVTFMLAPGPQEPLRPLAGVASGGESARIMLAMKAAPLAIAVTGVGEILQSLLMFVLAANLGTPLPLCIQSPYRPSALASFNRSVPTVLAMKAASLAIADTTVGGMLQSLLISVLAAVLRLLFLPAFIHGTRFQPQSGMAFPRKSLPVMLNMTAAPLTTTDKDLGEELVSLLFCPSSSAFYLAPGLNFCSPMTALSGTTKFESFPDCLGWTGF